ncbi:MAG: hypothetical protein II921_06560 [Treponema sp.]|nr:hypothetical protein [Treponema sp.]
MLSKILSKEDCASCRFCCSFRRQSLWETPLFDAETKNRLQARFPKARFRPVETESFTIDLSDCYKTNDSEEEAPCPFLDAGTGCVLSADEKPFDCSIWPLRTMRKDGSVIVALTPTCPSINKQPIEKIRELVVDEGLGRKIIEHSAKNPDMIKDFRPGFVPLME